MTKTVHPLMSHYCLVHKMGGGGRGGGTYSRGGAYFKFQSIGGVLIQKGRLFKGALIRRFAVDILFIKKIN